MTARTGNKRGWGSSGAIQTGRFIRDYLLRVGEAYPYRVWKELKAARESHGLKVCSPLGMYKYFKMLKDMGVLEPTGRVEVSERKSPIALRRYYRVIRGKENSPVWDDVQGHYRSWKESRT